MNPIHFIITSLAAAGAPADVPSDQAIIVTAALEPILQGETTVSTTLLQQETIERLALPWAVDLIRLLPGASIAVSGPPGSQAQLRIRGAEANHSLLFVDGIRFNDPAAGNEPRFELLASDSLSRIELVRGPQSALWGSEALGGVIAVQTGGRADGDRLAAVAEYGSLDSTRLSGSFAVDAGNLAVSGAGGLMQGDGIDAFGAEGERDGFRHKSASLKAVYAASPSAEFGLVGHWVRANSEFDGLDPLTFRRADTLDETANRIAAGRAWGKLGWGDEAAWSLAFGASILDSSNRNRLGDDPLNRTGGRRSSLDAQVARSLTIGGSEHRLILAAEHQHEEFMARDQQSSRDQDRSRSADAFTGTWRASWGDVAVTDLSLRHDAFSDFADATTARASLLVRVSRRWSLHGAYGEGIAQPTFYDLHGFFPGSFVGNPALRPEGSRGWEAGLRWEDARTKLAATAFAARLTDEIVDVFDPNTFLSSTENSSGRSKRRGVEIEAQHRLASGGLVGANYTYLDADHQQVAGTALVKEVRRPRHSANAFAALALGPASVGASLAYVGSRTDTDFDSFPARSVRLGDYLLASFSLGWKVTRRVELYGRVENGFGADYEDAYGYETPGRTVYAGLRLHLGD